MQGLHWCNFLSISLLSQFIIILDSLHILPVPSTLHFFTAQHLDELAVQSKENTCMKMCSSCGRGGNSRLWNHFITLVSIYKYSSGKCSLEIRPPTPKCYSHVKQILLCYNLHVHKVDYLNVKTNWNCDKSRCLFPHLLQYHISAYHAEAPVHKQLQQLLVQANCH